MPGASSELGPPWEFVKAAPVLMRDTVFPQPSLPKFLRGGRHRDAHGCRPQVLMHHPGVTQQSGRIGPTWWGFRPHGSRSHHPNLPGDPGVCKQR